MNRVSEIKNRSGADASLYSIEGSNLQKLLGNNSNLNAEYSETMELVNVLSKKPKIKSINTLENYFKSELFAEENYVGIANDFFPKLNEDSKIKPMDELLNNLKKSTTVEIAKECLRYIRCLCMYKLYAIYTTSLAKCDYDKDLDKLEDIYVPFEYSVFRYFSANCYGSLWREFYLSNAFKLFVKCGLCRVYIFFENWIEGIDKSDVIDIILTTMTDQTRYIFFKQFYKMLEDNLQGEDKNLFHNYLELCLKKLQDKKDNYKVFDECEINLTGIFIFGIIASAAVLTINLLEIYAATCFFYFGIVGVALTVAVGILLFSCLKENYNEIKLIDRAIEVYDLKKIKNFKESETKKILTLDVDKDKTILSNISNNRINKDGKGNKPKSYQISKE